MNDAKRVALGVTLAGKNQYKVLASVMENFSTATEATTAALNSSGSAAQENARYMESIEARAAAVSAAFQKMSTAVVDSDLVKGILDIGKGLAEFGSTGVGSAITQITLLSGLSWGGLQLLGQSILPGIIGSFKTFSQVANGVSISAIAAQSGITVLKASLAASLPVILGVVAAVVTLVAVIKAIKNAYNEAYPSVEAANLAMKDAQESLSETEKSYEKASEKLDALNSIPYEERSADIQAEIDSLKQLITYYENLLELKQEEVADKTKTYVSSIEREGFETNKYNVTGVIRAIDSPEYGTYGDVPLHTWKNSYDSLKEAIYGAANALLEFNGTVIDISNLSTAQTELENYGFLFEKQSVSVNEAINKFSEYTREINKNNEITPITIDNMRELINNTEEYANGLSLLKNNGKDLSEVENQFLVERDLLVSNYNDLIQSISDTTGATYTQTESMLQAAAALSSYAQNLINAANAYQIFKDRISETGDYDDTFKGFSSILKEVISEFDAGQVGSKTFLTGLELLTGQTFTSAEAVEYMNNNLGNLNLLFGDAESGGIGLITALQNLGYATLDSDGNIQIAIDDFSKLAGELGISESGLYSLVEALRVMGIDFQYNADSILANIAQMGVGIENGVIDFKEYAEAAKIAGMSNDEIVAIANILANVEGIELTNVAEGIALLSGNSENASSSAEDLNNELNEAGATSAGINDTASAVSGLAGELESAAGNAASLAGSLSSVSNFKAPSLGELLKGLFHAKGTSHAKEGMSLVNEEGPELIQSGNEAYIAGGGLPTVTHLHEGDRVYTAKETKSILGNKLLTKSIQAHPGGTDGTPNTNNKTSSTGITGIIGLLPASILSLLKLTDNKPSNNKPSKSKTSSKDPKEEFDEWLKAKKHALAMDEISEEEYYNSLREMNDKYFKNKKKYQDEYWKYEEQIYSWEKKKEEERIKEAEKLADEEAKAYKNEFDTWLKAQDHALAMDLITQEEYYIALEAMNNQYFKDKEEYQDEYWRYEEKIYAWRKRQEDELAKEQEQSIKDQIELEKKLNDLAKAQASRVKVFQNGQFRYVNDREALAKAQAAIYGYANGTYSANGGLSLVGESGAELRVLNKGDGVLPSDITKNLWGWGSLNPDFVFNKANDNNGQNYSFDIDSLVLPNVNDANSFVNGLKSFALQYSTQRG